MRAAQLFGPRDMRIVDVDSPDDPAAGEVLIRVTHCGICGTDAHEWDHGGPMAPLNRRHPASGHVGPMTIGHEFTGVVEGAGPGVDALTVGQRVVAGAGQSCGECRNCLAGRTNLCDSYFTFGLNIHGGMAEHVVVPASMCVAVPDACPSLRAALAQPLSIAMHAVSRAGLEVGDDVLVVGAGGIGALVIAAAADRDGIRVHVVDLAEGRLRAARELGADETALIDRADDTPPFPHLDVAFETSGTEAGLALALASVRRGGRVVVLGLPGRPIPVDTRRAVVDEIDLITSSAHVCAVDLPAAVELLARRPIDATVISDVISLDQLVEKGLDRLASGSAPGKVVVAIAPASELEHVGRISKENQP
jgi:(R,R)-butanediol dehydrogenase/meso-butanediol dehydrogenase/diacetyl reductase